LRLLGGAVEHGVDEPAERLLGLAAGVPDVEAERRRHLVVARAAGVDLAADLAEQALDRRVDVLVGLLEVAGGDRGEPPLDLRELRGREQSRGLEPPCVQAGPLEVVGKELGVARAQERPHLRSGGRADAAGPERHGPSSSGDSPRSSRWRVSIRRESSMSFHCTCSWPMRSVALKAVALRSIESRSGSYVIASPRVSRIV